jgi:hypothetical protein
VERVGKRWVQITTPPASQQCCGPAELAHLGEKTNGMVAITPMDHFKMVTRHTRAQLWRISFIHAALHLEHPLINAKVSDFETQQEKLNAFPGVRHDILQIKIL